ncbi:MAG: sulfatase [Acidobacteriota bacterium]
MTSRRALILFLITCAFTTGCGPRSSELPSDLSLLYGLVYTDDPFITVPGRRWDYVEAKQGWQFRTQASLWWFVRETPKESVSLFLQPAAESAGYSFLLLWDGEPLFEDPVAIDAEGLRIEIPIERLTPGNHQLKLRRRRGPRWDAQETSVDNVFAKMTLRTGESEEELVPERVPTYRRLADFLEFGAIGHDQEKRAGFVFLEPRAVDMTIYRSEAGSLRVTAENLAEGSARFVVQAGSQQAEKSFDGSGRALLQVPLVEGTNHLRFEIESPASGPFLWGAPFVSDAAVTSASDRRLPNIILLSLDTTRRDALTPYGAEAEVSPALASIAEHATVFERAHATAPWTLPSHASMFTGLYPSRHGAGVAHDKLPGDIANLAELLSDRGYYTAGFSGGSLTSSRFGLGQGFHQYRDPDTHETLGDRMTQMANEVLDIWGDQPVFLFLNYFDPHGPYQAPASARELTGVDRRLQALDDPQAWRATIEGRAGAWQELVAGRNQLPGEVMAYIRSVYLAEVAFMDSQIGILLERMRQDGSYDNSLILVTADHGQLLGEHGLHGHSLRLDTELIDIPLIIKWPRQREAKRTDDLTSLVDLFPTILEAVGITPPPSDGLALRPDGLAQASQGQREKVIMEEHESIVHPLRGPMRIAAHLTGLQGLDARQVWWRDGEHCELRGDEGWTDTACPPEDPRRFEIEQLLDAPVAEITAGAEPLSEEDRKRLEALGYL